MKAALIAIIILELKMAVARLVQPVVTRSVSLKALVADSEADFDGQFWRSPLSNLDILVC